MKKLALLLLLASCAERIPGLEVHASLRATQPVLLDVATVAIEEVQLNPCVQQAWWSPISTAYAHGVEVHDDPRLAHAPMTVDLTRADSQPLAKFTPPPGEICGVRIGFRPSTADAKWFGTTVFLEGTGFRQLATGARDVTLEIEPSFPNFSLELEATPPPAGTDAASTFEQFVSTLTVKVVR